VLARGAAALLAAQSLHRDVVVLDISMPGMSGLDVAVRLHESEAPIVVIVLTVHSEEDFVQAARSGRPRVCRQAPDWLRPEGAIREARAGREFVSGATTGCAVAGAITA
jgi:DNA-binding NarL/FixJ family response regulator